jgi:Fur family transcriptional regulator, peroxide stress response regulator
MKDTLNENARAVLDVLRASEDHPTALEVYEAVRRVRSRIRLATVYCILHQLAEQGLIRELQQNSEYRYDARTNRHDHAICTVCAALLDVPVEICLPDGVLQAVGITMGTHGVRIYGACRSCQPVEQLQSM